MPSEFGPTNTIVKHQSLETLKETYKQRLSVILYKQLTVENIETFADDALSDTVSLTEDILEESKKNPEFKYNSFLDKKTQEDEAYKILGLPDVQEILQSIIDKKDEINSLKTYIHENTENISKVITPPQENFKVKIEEGDGSFKEKKIFPRLLTLLYILQNDFKIEPKNIPIKEGITTSDMMRQTPYARVEIPDLERIVYICDEEGNASYIFDSKKLAEQKITIGELDLDDKEIKNSLIQKYSGIGVRLIQSKNWRENIVSLLDKEISEKQIKEIGDKQLEKKSEFKREKKVFLNFSDFQNEVKELYPGKIGVEAWFRKESIGHPSWTSRPDYTYRNDGWKGFPELVGLENKWKKEYLSFSDFQDEVKKSYLGQKEETSNWYFKEFKKHPNWPSKPSRTYKDKGWKGWPELVGKENLFKKPFLSFSDFQKEVKNLYQGKGNIQVWYFKERKNHFSWPSSPDKKYKNNGWIGWPELVDIENKFKKRYLSLSDFQKEVISLYSGDGSIVKWYNEEQKKHSNWYPNPAKFYENKGWKGWPELVDKKKE